MEKLQFDYEKLQDILTEYKQEFPELIPSIENYWKQITSFTILEAIPALQNYFFEKYNQRYTIQLRHVLTPNPRKSIWEEETYHLSTEYYAYPASIYLLLQNHIMLDRTLYKYNKKYKQEKMETLNPIEEIYFTPMDNEELYQKQKMDNYFQECKDKEAIIFITKEEKDLTIDEILQPQSWESQRLSLEKRNINPAIPIKLFIQYINNRENGIPYDQLSDQEIEDLLTEFLKHQ